ncbi:unnamed product [Ostreococcus tauri]|uniref:Protein transport protein SEC23 n=1 Tax=Ostreococcus tauri TaxID=70448 RepID=A0A090M4C6_OSTTA|nr:unnamed product [Ostreococcus tauri]CEF99090.1 unnamed product [Ostreococcus tauri]|eukprot:XP_022839641.1 unnamed product [Ostreococcus tauri]
MDFTELEHREGARLSWNAWPCSRIEATRVVLPIGALVTPGKDLGEHCPTLPYEPVVCEGCQAAEIDVQKIVSSSIGDGPNIARKLALSWSSRVLAE